MDTVRSESGMGTVRSEGGTGTAGSKSERGAAGNRGENGSERTENVRIRLTSEEKKWLEQQAEASGARKTQKRGVNLSAYLRFLVLQDSGFRDGATAKYLRDLNYEVNKIGTNINQAVRKINSGFGSYSDICELKDELAAVEAAVRETRNSVERIVTDREEPMESGE